MPAPELLPLDEIVARLERVLAASPADETDIVWWESRLAQESGTRRREPFERGERTVLVRVRERGRLGFHRTGAGSPGEIENAVREALAAARIGPRIDARIESPAAPPAAEGAAEPAAPALWDEELAKLRPPRAKELLQQLVDRGESGRLSWTELRVAALGSNGLRRTAEATGVALAVGCGRGPGAGRAAAVARSLAGLDAGRVVERARERQAREAEAAELPEAPAALLLSPEAAARLLDLLNRYALTSSSFLDGTSCLREALGRPLFDAGVNLRDDGTDPRGLPFPFDFLGAAKRPVDLVAGGVPLTPAVDERLAAELGRPVTPHSIAPDEARATNLFLLPGGRADGELAREGEGGLWVGSLEPLEGFDPRALRFRAVARGVRRLADGRPGRAAPDFLWEDSVPAVLARVRGVGAEPVAVAEDDSLLGAISAPCLLVADPPAVRPA